MNVIIREVSEADVVAISEITIAAFKTLPVSNHTEQFVISALRAANALTVSLVAVTDRRVVGHIAFSPVTVSDGSAGWYGAGPLSVLPERQRQGIGKALMDEGLCRLKALGAKGCVLVGEPGYYERFGFRNLPELALEGVPQEYFLALPFGQNTSSGTVAFHEGFAATG